MAIYLIRHGETDWNRQGRFQGVEDIELNGTGVLQAKACAEALRALPVDKVVTSPLKRAKKTAEIIASRLGAALTVEEGLTERDFGKMSGLTKAEREAFAASGEDPKMEPFDALADRMMAAVEKYAGEECAVLVSHGASINAVLARLSDGAFGTGKTILKNTCLNKLSGGKGTLRVEYYNLSVGEFLSRPEK